MKVQAKDGKVTQNMHGASRNYRYVWDVSIDYLPCRGTLMFSLHARISRVAYTLLGNAPPRLSDTPRPILRLIREAPPVYSPKRSGVLGHRPSHSGSLCAKWIKCRSTIRPNHNNELDVFHSFRTRPQ